MSLKRHFQNNDLSFSSFQLLEPVQLDSTGRSLPVSRVVSEHTNHLQDGESALRAPMEVQPPQQDSQLCLDAAVSPILRLNS